jgi:hypothetical protein
VDFAVGDKRDKAGLWRGLLLDLVGGAAGPAAGDEARAVFRRDESEIVDVLGVTDITFDRGFVEGGTRRKNEVVDPEFAKVVEKVAFCGIAFRVAEIETSARTLAQVIALSESTEGALDRSHSP